MCNHAECVRHDETVCFSNLQSTQMLSSFVLFYYSTFCFALKKNLYATTTTTHTCFETFRIYSVPFILWWCRIRNCLMTKILSLKNNLRHIIFVFIKLLNRIKKKWNYYVFIFQTLQIRIGSWEIFLLHCSVRSVRRFLFTCSFGF